jgi:hypothetical protein
LSVCDILNHVYDSRSREGENRILFSDRWFHL